MKKKNGLLTALTILSFTNSWAAIDSKSSDQEGQSKEDKSDKSDYATKEDVELAIKYFQGKTPTVTQDSLRVWKNYKSGKSDPNYLYKFWARDVILWLRENRKLSFDSQDKIGCVFILMNEMGLISKDAVVLLSQSVWSLLIHREGIPDIEKRFEKEDELRKLHTPLGKKKETNV